MQKTLIDSISKKKPELYKKKVETYLAQLEDENILFEEKNKIKEDAINVLEHAGLDLDTRIEYYSLFFNPFLIFIYL